MNVSINELFKYEMTAPKADTVDAEDFVGVKPRLSDSSTSSWMDEGQSALVVPIHRKKHIRDLSTIRNGLSLTNLP